MNDKYTPHNWAPHERPTIPGSPSTPLHSTPKRLAFAVVGVIVALTGGLGNALVVANLQYLQGPLGATQAEIAWLPAAYVMTNVSINLLLVKFRQQYGLRAFTEGFLVLYALVTFAHLFVNDISSAIAVRAAHGMVGAALSSLGLYYMIQAFPQKWRMKALVLGLGTAQLAIPLARLVSEDLLQIAEWRGLYLFELGMCLLSLGCVLILKLPPGDRFKAFEKLDFLTFALLASGFAALCAALSLGRIEWWLEEPWIGIALAFSIVTICAGLAIEHNRTRPLLITRWLGSGRMLRFALSVLLTRIVLSEQATGAVGFFTRTEPRLAAAAHAVPLHAAGQRCRVVGQCTDHRPTAPVQATDHLAGVDGHRFRHGQFLHQSDPGTADVFQSVLAGLWRHVLSGADAGVGHQRRDQQPA